MQQGRLIQAAVAMALAHAMTARAAEFTLDNGAQVSWKTTVSLGQARRAENRDPHLLNANNASLLGIGGTTGGNTDDGDLNYGKWQPFTTLLNLSSEVGVRKGELGGALGARAWRDFTLESGDVAHGSFNNRYQAGTPLKDTGFERFARFSNVALMNAYVYDSFETAPGKLKLTLGRHVLNWGQELFIQGLNQINALNLNAIREPGLERGDIQLPQGMLSARLDMDKGRSVEAFWQFQFQDNVYPGCGTYFLPVDASVGPNAQNACSAGLIQTTRAAGDAGGQAAGLYAPAAATRMPAGANQFGLAMHWPLASLGTDLGAYAMKIDSRNPILSAVKGNSPFLATTPALGAAGAQSSLFWEYPQDLGVFGLSARSKLGGWALGSELSYFPNFPVQLAGGDLLAGYVYSANPAVLSALLQGAGVPAAAAPTIAALMHANEGPLTARYAAAANGGTVHGYDTVRKVQLQLNAVRGIPGVLGTQAMTIAGELGIQYADVPDHANGTRYGRSFVFGTANAPSYNLGAYTALPGALGAVGRAVTQGGSCPILNATGQAGCRDDGFVTPWSIGYRLRTQLVYANVFGSSVTLKPTLFFSSDVSGYSADGQFNAGRRITQLSLVAEFARRWTAELTSVAYSHDASWDPLRDRDYYAASVKVAF
jgi:hypothetical protein